MYPAEEYPEGCTINAEAEAWTDFFEKNAVCLLDGAVGIFIPQEFARDYEMDEWHVDQADVNILLSGPDHELYWDTWERVLNNAYFDNFRPGRRYTLHQESDLFAVPDPILL